MNLLKDDQKQFLLTFAAAHSRVLYKLTQHIHNSLRGHLEFSAIYVVNITFWL